MLKIVFELFGEVSKTVLCERKDQGNEGLRCGVIYWLPSLLDPNQGLLPDNGRSTLLGSNRCQVV